MTQKPREGWQGKLWPENFDSVISIPLLNSDDYREMEGILGAPLTRAQRRAIAKARKNYVLFQSWEWSANRPRLVRKAATTIEKSLATTRLLLEDLSAAANTDDKALKEQLAAELTLRIRHPQHRDAIRSLRSTAGANSDLSESTIGQFLTLANLLSDSLKSVVQNLPSDRGGRHQAKSQFGEYISTLADVFESAGGSIAVSFKDSQGLYPMVGFLGFVEVSSRNLPSKFNYSGLSFGKEVSKAIGSRERTRT